MNLKLVAAFFVSLGLVFPPAPAAAEQRVALVIGNGAYEKAETLPNPKNDAEDVAAALKRAGFETIVGIDLNKTDMEDATFRFARKARNADVALFYYSGHALQFGGVNYLLPVDADLKDEVDLRRMARLDQIVQDLQRAKNLRILVLDSCRDNPLAEQLKRSIGLTRAASLHRGLARIDSPQGMIVAFATQAGLTAADGTGRNSPYTTAFLNHIETKEEIGDVFRRIAAQVYNATGRVQLPELSLSLIGEYYLHGKPSLPVAPTADACSVWPQINATKSVAEVKAFLAVCGSGTYNTLAKARLSELERQETAAISDPLKPTVETPAKPASGALSEESHPSPVLEKEKEGKRQPEPAWWERARKERRQGEDAVEKSQRAIEAEEWSRQEEERRRVELARRQEAKARSQKAEAEKGEARRTQAEANAIFDRAYRLDKNGNRTEAARLYRQAVELGNSYAMNNLGVLYKTGRGVAKDEAEAVRLYRMAADKGNAFAATNLGIAYDEGSGVAKDRRAAARHVFDALRLREPSAVKHMTTNSRAWSKEFRSELQRLLRDAGVYDGAIDGSFGQGTRRAIAVLSGARKKPESINLNSGTSKAGVFENSVLLGGDVLRTKTGENIAIPAKCEAECLEDSQCVAFVFYGRYKKNLWGWGVPSDQCVFYGGNPEVTNGRGTAYILEK